MTTDADHPQPRDWGQPGPTTGIVVQEFVSLDGVMQAPGDTTEFERGGWQRPYIDADQMRLMSEQLEEADALLLGRKTYEHFAIAWPQMSGDPFSDRMNAMPKLVASRTQSSTTWNATLIEGDVVGALTARKAQPGRNLLVAGSGDLLRTLIAHDLVDEYRLWIAPVVVGAGTRLFGDQPTRALRLVASETTTSGIAILTYRPAARPAE